VLAANQRIGEEIKAIPKATQAGPGRGKTKSPASEIVCGRAATGVPKDARSRLGKLRLDLQAKTQGHRDEEIKAIPGASGRPVKIITELGKNKPGRAAWHPGHEPLSPWQALNRKP